MKPIKERIKSAIEAIESGVAIPEKFLSETLYGALLRIEKLEQVCLSEMTKDAQALGLYDQVE